MGKNHSPCVINLDSIEGFGTHWVCCWFSKDLFEYFDSFGLPPPLEWEENLRSHVSQGLVVGSGQVGGFLGMLASLGIRLAIELVKSVIGKGVYIQPPKGKGLHVKRAAGMRLEPPPPVGGSWDQKKIPGCTFK